MGCCFGRQRKYENTSYNTSSHTTESESELSSNRSLLSSPRKIRKVFARKSSPSKVSSKEMTDIYTVPNVQFITPNDVIRYHGYELMNEIGKGGYAIVYKARRISDHLIVACKKVKIMSNRKSQKRRMTDTKNELFVMEKTRHPHIVTMFEHYIINDFIYIFMEYATGGSLTDLIKRKGPLEEKSCKLLFAQMVSALKHMHQKGIAHRDLKCDNILLDENKNVIISDFGLSRVVYRQSKGGVQLSRSYCGTEPYMAPEIIQKHRLYDPFPADVWALGVILFAMLNRCYPFNTENKQQMLTRQLSGRWHFSRKAPPPSPLLMSLLNVLLAPDVKNRIKINVLSQHPWINNETLMVLSAVESQIS